MVLGVGECRFSHQVGFLFVDAGVRGVNFMCKISIRGRFGIIPVPPLPCASSVGRCVPRVSTGHCWTHRPKCDR